jgi:hypothetical protein
VSSSLNDFEMFRYQFRYQISLLFCGKIAYVTLDTMTGKTMQRQLLLMLVASLLALSKAFVPFQRTRSVRRETLVATHLWDDELQPPSPGELSSDLDCLQAPESNDLHRLLKDRQKALQQGIGKRYVCRTQRGFLNVHLEPGDPFDTSNIVTQLKDGDIVVSTGPNRGPWVRHDGGGWSVAIFGGFKWLELLVE